MSKYKKDRKIIRFIALNLFVFFVSVYFLSASGPNFYNTDAGELRIQVAKSIVEKHDLSIPKAVAIKGDDGRYYSWVGIGSALLAVPFYIAGKFFSDPRTTVTIMNQLAGAATVVLVFFFTIFLGYPKRVSLLISFFYGLGTISWPMAKHPFDHVIETLFVLLSVYCMYRYLVERKVLFLVVSSFSLGIAFITRTTSILIIPSLFVLMVLYQVKEADFKKITRNIISDIFLFSLVFAPFLCLSIWYNYYRFGSIFETGYQLISARTGIEFFSKTSFLNGLSGLLISPGKGFFYYSPVAIFFFFSIKSFMKRHMRLGIAFILIILSYLLFYSKYVYWHGDWAWGPRYIFVLTPFLIIPIAALIDPLIMQKKRFLKVIIIIIFIASIIIQIAAISVDFQKYFFHLRAEEELKFVFDKGSKVQRILVEPYFDWHKSPILAQFRFIYDIAGKVSDYQYSDLSVNSTLAEKIKVNPYMNIFDFWWMYKYFLEGSYYGFIVALLLILVAIYCASRLWKYAK